MMGTCRFPLGLVRRLREIRSILCLVKEQMNPGGHSFLEHVCNLVLEN